MFMARQRRPGPQVLSVTLRDRLERANQHGLRDARPPGDDVEAVPEAIDEVDVGMAGRSEHHLGPLGPAAAECAARSSGPRYASVSTMRPMRRVPAVVVYQVHADELARDEQRISVVECGLKLYQ